MAIVSMLMVAAMTVAANMARAEARALAKHDDTWLREPLRELLTMDLLNATSCDKTERGYEIQTAASLDPTTMELRHLPNAVQYELRPHRGSSWLVRTQHPLTAGPDVAEVVCSGLKDFQLESVTAADGTTTTTVSIEFSDPKRRSLSCVIGPRREPQ